jgi:hypothetical protein
MTVQDAIPLEKICRYYNIEIEVVLDFADFGLFPTLYEAEQTSIERRHLKRLAEIITLYQALGINKEGIEVVSRLRERINGLEDEIERLHVEVERLGYRLGQEDPEVLSRLGMLIDV